LDEAEKASIRGDIAQLDMLDPHIGNLLLEAVHMGCPQLQKFLEQRKKAGKKRRTINAALQVIRHILNLAAGEWRDEHGLTWLAHAPKIKLFRESDKRPAYPLSWDEQMRLFGKLPPHLVKMSLFAVNSGCREQEICNLRWEWEVKVPKLKTSVFIIPPLFDENEDKGVKNREERFVVLNRVAKAIVEEMRGKHPTHVFSYKGKPVKSMNTTSWKKARKAAKLPYVRVHDLKHTFGRRLRAAGVSFEDRQDLLGHKSGRITTHYSMPELESLIAAANAVCEKNSRKTHAILLLRHSATDSGTQQVTDNTG